MHQILNITNILKGYYTFQNLSSCGVSASQRDVKCSTNKSDRSSHKCDPVRNKQCSYCTRGQISPGQHYLLKQQPHIEQKPPSNSSHTEEGTKLIVTVATIRVNTVCFYSALINTASQSHGSQALFTSKYIPLMNLGVNSSDSLEPHLILMLARIWSNYSLSPLY